MVESISTSGLTPLDDGTETTIRETPPPGSKTKTKSTGDGVIRTMPGFFAGPSAQFPEPPFLKSKSLFACLVARFGPARPLIITPRGMAARNAARHPRPPPAGVRAAVSRGLAAWVGSANGCGGVRGPRHPVDAATIVT